MRAEACVDWNTTLIGTTLKLTLWQILALVSEMSAYEYIILCTVQTNIKHTVKYINSLINRCTLTTNLFGYPSSKQRATLSILTTAKDGTTPNS